MEYSRNRRSELSEFFFSKYSKSTLAGDAYALAFPL